MKVLFHNILQVINSLIKLPVFNLNLKKPVRKGFVTV